MAAVACNSSHRMTHDVELSYTNLARHDDIDTDIVSDIGHGDLLS